MSGAQTTVAPGMVTRHSKARKRTGTQRGQALSEFLLVCMVLIPLFLLIPLIAKYGHIKQMGQQATRNAVWEASVARDYRVPAVGEVERRLRDRAFAKSDARITTNPPSVTELNDQLLVTHSGRKLLEPSDASLTSLTDAQAPGFLEKTISSLPNFLPGEFPPNKNGYVTASSELKVRNLTYADGSAMTSMKPFDTIDLRMKSNQTLLVDAWNASGPINGRRSVREQVRTFVPGSNLTVVQPVLDTVGSLPLPILGKLNDLKIGTIEPDYVPYDRLRPYGSKGP